MLRLLCEIPLHQGFGQTQPKIARIQQQFLFSSSCVIVCVCLFSVFSFIFLFFFFILAMKSGNTVSRHLQTKNFIRRLVSTKQKFRLVRFRSYLLFFRYFSLFIFVIIFFPYFFASCKSQDQSSRAELSQTNVQQCQRQKHCRFQSYPIIKTFSFLIVSLFHNFWGKIRIF